MENSKIVRHILALPVKEREKFRLFVQSPYFNQHQKTGELLDVILDSSKKKKALEKEKAFKRLFPKEVFDEQKLYNLMSNLKKLLNRFFSQQYLEQHPQMEELFTIETAFEKSQFDLLTNRAKQLRKHLDAHNSQDHNHFYIEYRLYHLLGYYGSSYVDRSKSEALQTMMNKLDKFYILEKLRNSCHLTANTMIVNTQYDFGILDELLGYLETSWDQFKDDISIDLYYTILMMLKDDQDTNHYQHLKELLLNKINLFSASEQQDLYGFLNNYCILKINRGESDYQKELFDLYQQGLEQEILLSNGVIFEWDYKNIATLGAKLEEFEWTENFLLTYKDRLPANQRENAYTYNLANLYYNKKMYNDALSTLLHVQFTDVKYHLNTYFLLLRTYYAMEDTEALLSLIDTFRIYVLRNRKITTDQKKGYINFLRFAKKLVLIKHHHYAYTKKSFREKLQELKQQIDHSENVINRYWLEEECVN